MDYSLRSKKGTNPFEDNDESPFTQAKILTRGPTSFDRESSNDKRNEPKQVSSLEEIFDVL